MEGPIINLWIQDAVVVLLEWDSDNNPIRAAVAFNRLSALRIYEEWLAGRDPEGLRVVQEAFLEESAVPWTSPLSPDFRIPTACLEEFAKFLMIGSRTCTDLQQENPENLLDTMVADGPPLYCYATAEEPIILLLYLGENDVASATVLRDQSTGKEALSQMTRYSEADKETLRKAFETLPTKSDKPSFFFHQVTAAVLLIGAIVIRAMEEEIASLSHQLG